jgi:hypothetical protein
MLLIVRPEPRSALLATAQLSDEFTRRPSGEKGARAMSAHGPRRSMALGITARAPYLSIVIAGLDPAIRAENLLARFFRAASHAGCHHGPPGQARW